MRVVFWGTYDTGKPRVRILMRGLRENGVEVIECHKDVWGGIEDKSQIHGAFLKIRLLFRWLFSYPKLIWRYFLLPKHDVVVVGYLGQLDVLILWLFAKLRGVPIVWDAFLSLYNTVVEDRRMVSPTNPIARIIWYWEWLACRMATMIILDTDVHGRYFKDTFGASEAKIKRVFVGAETDLFKPRAMQVRDTTKPFTILFYGQFIPLHGVETVIRAAKLTEAEHFRWVIIGTGQEAGRIRILVNEIKPAGLEWLEWVPYTDLINWIHQADLCLGIFGGTDKATRVIPNKVFQILAAERPMITGDTPAIRELLCDNDGYTLVPVADAAALGASVVKASRQLNELNYKSLRTQLTPACVTKPLIKLIKISRTERN